MGLRITLHQFKNGLPPDFLKRNKTFQEAEDNLLDTFYHGSTTAKTYAQLDPVQKGELAQRMETLQKEYHVTRAMNPDGTVHKHVVKDSTLHPGHSFRVGSWFSSSTEAGLNSVLRDYVGRDLYSCFGVEGRWSQPDWEDSLERVQALLADFKSATTEGFRVMPLTYNPFKDVKKEAIKTSNDALISWCIEQRKVPKDDIYANRHGTFFPKDVEIHAAIEGVDITGAPTQYLIYKKRDTDDPKHFVFYLEALEIIIETIEYVLAQADPSQYVLQWV